MTDQVTQTTPQEDTRPPWEIDYNPIVQKAQEAVKTVSDGITNAAKAILPWDTDWGAKRPVEAPSPVQKPDNSSYQFNQVFNRLIVAESKGKHTDAKGNLINSGLPNDPAEGITQLRQSTANNPGFGITPVQDKSEGEYLRVGKQYLQALLNEFGGDYRKAVAAYNAGIGNVKKAITKGGDNWEQYLPKKSETLPYLNRVLG